MGSRLIVFGGFAPSSSDAGRGADETWILDLGSGAWRRAADMPAPRSFFGSAQVDGRILAIGGGIDQYDPGTDQWTLVLPSGTFPDSHFGAAAVGRRVYAVGGFPARAGGCVGYDLDSREVLDTPGLPGFHPGDHFHIVAALRGELHVVGGLDGETFRAKPEHWVLRGNRWASAAPPPEPVFAKFAAAQAADDALYIFQESGGWRYDANSDRWCAAAPLDTALVMPASVTLQGAIVVIGGLEPEGGPTAAARCYRIESDTWDPKGPR